jgi:hypothetical protein
MSIHVDSLPCFLGSNVVVLFCKLVEASKIEVRLLSAPPTILRHHSISADFPPANLWPQRVLGHNGGKPLHFIDVVFGKNCLALIFTLKNNIDGILEVTPRCWNKVDVSDVD